MYVIPEDYFAQPDYYNPPAGEAFHAPSAVSASGNIGGGVLFMALALGGYLLLRGASKKRYGGA
jgi:hypothetical protein